MIGSPNLGDSSVNIANVFQGREFLPPNKVGDIFTEQPNENNIHIIVELPTPAARGSDNEILVRLENKVDNIDKDV